MINVRVDSQILNVIQTCKRKAKFQFLDNYETIEQIDAFQKGIMVHAILDVFGKQRMANVNYKDAVVKALGVGEDWSLTNSIDLDDKNTVMDTMVKYFDYYRGDSWIIKSSEEFFSNVLFQNDDVRILYEGIIDWTVEIASVGIGVVDHKSTTRNKPFFSLHNQFLGYAWAKKTKLIIVDRIGFQKTLAPKDRFLRPMASFTDDVINTWVADTIHSVLEWVQYFQAGVFPHNFNSCNAGYKPCQYHKVCEHGENNELMVLESEFARRTEPWDPMKRDDE